MAGTTDSVTTLSCRPPDDVGGACVTPSCCRLDLGPLHPAWRFRNPLSHASTALAVWPHSFLPPYAQFGCLVCQACLNVAHAPCVPTPLPWPPQVSWLFCAGPQHAPGAGGVARQLE
jgi:hypothetical protein